jgi:sialidase-1
VNLVSSFRQGTDLVFKRSVDEGQTWSPIQVLYSNSSDTETNVVGNAAPVQDQQSGRIWIPFCRNNVEVYITYSDDDGATWSTPTYHPELTRSDWKWIGLGPPGGLQLQQAPYAGRLVIPSYHTIKWKGDGCDSFGHILYSDDSGATWSIGPTTNIGYPSYLVNENQAVELANGSVLINARTVSNRRVQILSVDGGATFHEPYVVESLEEPWEGCEGSFVRDAQRQEVYFSGATSSHSPVRLRLALFVSADEGATWHERMMIDDGAVAYSSLQVIPAQRAASRTGLEVLYERSNVTQLVFEPDEIRYYRIW